MAGFHKNGGRLLEFRRDNCTYGEGSRDPTVAVWRHSSDEGLAAEEVAMEGTCRQRGQCQHARYSQHRIQSAGKFQLLVGLAGGKIKGGRGTVFARVAGDTATTSALAIGIVTKGFGAGASFETQIGLDLPGTTNCGVTKCNTLILACNTGAICPPDVFDPNSHSGDTAVTTLDLVSIPSSHVDISIPSNADCTGAGTPVKCCTGVSAGTC